MAQKRNRWWINLVLAFGLVAFLGLSTLPLLGSIFQQNPSSSGTPSPSQTTPSAQQAELAAQVKGYELVLQREPENQTALKGLVEARLRMVQLKLADIKTVIEPLEKLVKLNPNQTNYAILLAQAKQYTGDREGSAQTYRAVLESQPGNIQALQGLVELFLQQNRPEAAIGLLQDTLKTADQANQIQAGSIDVTSVQLELGRVYAEQKRYAEALAAYDGAIKEDEHDFRPFLAKGWIFQEQGKPEEAELLFSKALDLAPAQFKDGIKDEIAKLSTEKSGAENDADTTVPSDPKE